MHRFSKNVVNKVTLRLIFINLKSILRNNILHIASREVWNWFEGNILLKYVKELFHNFSFRNRAKFTLLQNSLLPPINKVFLAIFVWYQDKLRHLILYAKCQVTTYYITAKIIEEYVVYERFVFCSYSCWRCDQWIKGIGGV